jgi:hypothetical protein
LQHTPDVKAAFAALPEQLKSGGKLAVDVYPKTIKNWVWPKYWLRPLTRRLNPHRLFTIVQRLTPSLLAVSRMIGRAPWIGRQLRYAVPVANYEGVYPLSKQQLKEWAVLDTFDMLSPAYDSPQSRETLKKWADESGLSDIEVIADGFNVCRAMRR